MVSTTGSVCLMTMLLCALAARDVHCLESEDIAATEDFRFLRAEPHEFISSLATGDSQPSGPVVFDFYMQAWVSNDDVDALAALTSSKEPSRPVVHLYNSRLIRVSTVGAEARRLLFSCVTGHYPLYPAEEKRLQQLSDEELLVKVRRLLGENKRE